MCVDSEVLKGICTYCTDENTVFAESQDQQQPTKTLNFYYTVKMKSNSINILKVIFQTIVLGTGSHVRVFKAKIKKLVLFNHFISAEKENGGERWSKLGTPLQSNGWFGKIQECQKFRPS